MNVRTHIEIGILMARFWRRQRAASAAEFAMVLPILVLMLFGTIEVGRALHDYQLVDKSVRHAARYLSRMDLTCPGGDFAAAYKTNAKNLALKGTIDGSGDYLLKYWTDPTTIDIVPCQPVVAKGAFEGVFKDPKYVDIPSFTVTAEVPIFLNFGSSWLGNLSINVVVQHEEVAIGE